MIIERKSGQVNMSKTRRVWKNLGYPHYASRKFTPEEYKVYVKNNNKIFEYTGEDKIVSVTEKEYKLPFQRTIWILLRQKIQKSYLILWTSI